MRIEVLTAADAEILRSVAPGVFDDPVDERASAEFLADPRHHLVVAIDAATVVGFVSAVDTVHPDAAAPELWIDEVAVAPSRRGQGIARRMLAAVLDLAGRLGCSEAWVLADASNRAAQNLYRAAGGVAHDDAVVMYTFTPPSGADA